MGTVSVPLTQGKAAIIDEEDLPLVLGRSWYAAERQYAWYAATSEMRNGRPFIVLMHRLLVNAPSGAVVDHKDHDGLNNCRGNLRLTVQSFNAVNTGPRSHNTTGFKGVTWRKNDKKFLAQMRFMRKHYYLGRYSTAEEAARAYDAKARELHGEFARLNFP